MIQSKTLIIIMIGKRVSDAWKGKYNLIEAIRCEKMSYLSLVGLTHTKRLQEHKLTF